MPIPNPSRRDFLRSAVALATPLPVRAPQNRLTPEERADGWLLLFDGETLNGWKTDTGQPSRRPVEGGALNPHGCGGYMLVHERQWSDFILDLDFKLSRGCNSGVFIRTFPLTPRSGKDVGFNGLEVALDDTPGAGYHDTGALYDLVPPRRNTMRAAGEWNDLRVTCRGAMIQVAVNGETVTEADLDRFAQPNRRPDGSVHKFDIAYREHPRRGYVGLQDHGAPCWFKNIKLRPLP